MATVIETDTSTMTDDSGSEENPVTSTVAGNDSGSNVADVAADVAGSVAGAVSEVSHDNLAESERDNHMLIKLGEIDVELKSVNARLNEIASKVWEVASHDTVESETKELITDDGDGDNDNGADTIIPERSHTWFRSMGEMRGE